MAELSDYYDPDIFVDRESLSDPDIVCVICTLVAADAVETPCGHLFCGHCMTATLQARAGSCPSCRSPIEVNGARPAAMMRRLIDGKRVRCIFAAAALVEVAVAADGSGVAPVVVPVVECKWQGRRGDLKQHVDTICVAARITCDACTDSIRRGELASHALICRKRVIACEHCDTKVGVEDMATHVPLCDGVPVQCVNDCKTVGLRRRDMILHATVCPLVPTPCSYAIYGCDYSATRDRLTLHMTDPSSIATHLSLTTTHITTLTATNRQLTATCDALSQRMDLITGNFEALASEWRYQREVSAVLADQNRAIIQELKQAPTATKTGILSRVFGGSATSTPRAAPVVDRSPRSVPASVPVGVNILLPHVHPLTYMPNVHGRACDGCNKALVAAFQCVHCSFDLCHSCADASRDAAADVVADAREAKRATDAIRRFTVTVTNRHRHALSFAVRIRDRRCDLCRLSPCVEAYQCAACDFDCCLTCFETATGRSSLPRAPPLALTTLSAPAPAPAAAAPATPAVAAP